MHGRKAVLFGLVLSFLVAFQGLPGTAASQLPSDVGEWGTPIDVGVIGIHAALLPTGRILLFTYPYGGVGSPPERSPTSP